MTDLRPRLQPALANRYLIEREVGRGGMATVYLAQDLKHDRLVVLKVLHPELAASLGPERFLREIKVAARLNHPHIVPLYDSGQAGDFLYYVMPYVEGESLRQRLTREKQLPLEDALQIARNVAAALDYAHRHQVVHRDIKPENVMLHEGEALVTDFGIAKAISVAGGESLTQTGVAVGTPAYMSPEQAAGEAEPDGRSDVYSLGCMLYEMLAGATPFTGPTAQVVISKRFTEPVPSLRAARPTVPEVVEQAVTRALAKVPADRFATAAQLAQALVVHSGTTPPGITPVSQATASAAKSIAVLPFADMSPQRDQDYFCEGMAEELINALMKIEELHVASRTSAFGFKGKNEDILEIGRQLNVGSVLGGSVRKAGAKLRITAQLIKVADGYHIWSERYDRDMEDVFAIQDEIAQNIARALRVVLSEKEKRAIEKAATTDVEAYDYYLRGRQYFHQFRRKGFEFARRMFARATELDPGYARAYAGAADCSSFLYMYWEADETHLQEADTASRRALELDPELAEAHAARGMASAVRKQYTQAAEEFETAIRLNPKLFEPYYFYARACFVQGNLDEAARLYEQACRVRPEDYQAPSLLATVYEGLGRKADAEAVSRRALQMIEKHVEMHPDDARALYFGAGALCRAGRREECLNWTHRALGIDSEEPLTLYNVACVYALLGRADEAVDCLEKCINHGTGNREWIKNDSDLDSLRSHPRFQALLSAQVVP